MDKKFSNDAKNIGKRFLPSSLQNQINMRKVTVPHKGKNYEFNCYAAPLENEIVFCFATPDGKTLPPLPGDFFFLKINRYDPTRICANDGSAEFVELVSAAAKVVSERFLAVRKPAPIG